MSTKGICISPLGVARGEGEGEENKNTNLDRHKYAGICYGWEDTNTRRISLFFFYFLPSPLRPPFFFPGVATLEAFQLSHFLVHLTGVDDGVWEWTHTIGDCMVMST